MKELKQCLVLGVGNVLMGDDGVGVRAVEAFEARYKLGEGVEVLDGGTGGLALLEFIQGFESVIVIDAIASNAAPGSIEQYTDEELKTARQLTRPSAHQIGLYELIETARFGGNAPSVTLIGVVPERVEAGAPLSNKIADRIEQVADRVAAELKRLGIECNPRPENA
jgi:hydrogenase maturation protease